MPDRDLNGRLLPGHSLKSPGRPPVRIEQQRQVEMERMLLEAVTPADWREICDTAVTGAKKGNVHDREWVSKYTIGTPAANIRLTAVQQKLMLEIIDRYNTLEIDITQGLSAHLKTLDRHVEEKRRREIEAYPDATTVNG